MTVFALEEEKCQNSKVELSRVSSHSCYELLVHAEKKEEKKLHNKQFFTGSPCCLRLFYISLQIYRATTLSINASCSKKVTLQVEL